MHTGYTKKKQSALYRLCIEELLSDLDCVYVSILCNAQRLDNINGACFGRATQKLTSSC
jgi:hypothetical protein